MGDQREERIPVQKEGAGLFSLADEKLIEFFPGYGNHERLGITARERVIEAAGKINSADYIFDDRGEIEGEQPHGPEVEASPAGFPPGELGLFKQ